MKKGSAKKTRAGGGKGSRPKKAGARAEDHGAAIGERVDSIIKAQAGAARRTPVRVDRIEDGAVAVVELPDGSTLDVPAGCLPDGIAGGEPLVMVFER